MGITQAAGTNLQPGPRASQVHPRQAAGEHLLDLELSLGGQSGHDGAGQPLLDDDRGPAGGVAGVRGAPSGTR